MNELGLTFHHVGMAVPQPEPAIAFLSALGYAIGETTLDPLQDVRLIMCTHPTQPAVEVISPGSAEGKGPIAEMTKRNAAGIVYHQCYGTMNLLETLRCLGELGLSVRCVSEPKPAVLFGGRRVSFYRITGMGLVELLELTTEAAGAADC